MRTDASTSYSPVMSLRDILRDLSAKHSLIQMHTELLSMMKEEYAALKEFFAPSEQEQKSKTKPKQKKGAVEEPAVVASSAVKEKEQEKEHEKEKEKEQSQTTESLRVIANTKIRIVKKEALPEPEPKPEPKPASQEQQKEQEHEKEQTQTSKDLKAWQKEQEQKKLAQLTAQGVNPETLLTVDSIKKWIIDEKRTFAYVAREYLGMPESKVADFARKHNVKSTISKNRAIIAAKKH